MQNRREQANALRVLAIDAVQAARSGHPGMPMGMADIAEVLWNDFLQHHPADPNWLNRDRFVLSNGHGSMLLYGLLYLTGYNVSLDDLRHFRQLHSKTPGHPEFGETPGVETTTGPLGQGLANAIGMAIAEKHLAAEFNRKDHAIIDHFTYAFIGDGCLMEGISHEVCSLAGTLGLGKLIVFYDDNQISIDGNVHGWFTDHTPQRFESYGWHVIPAIDGHDSSAIHQAILAAQKETSRPTLICCKTVIGWGSPQRAGTAKAHGEALGEEEVLATRKNLQWPHPAFVIPEHVLKQWNALEKGEARKKKWDTLFTSYTNHYPEEAKELTRRLTQKLPEQWTRIADDFIKNTQLSMADIASRKASEHCLNYFAPHLPELIGGSADLTGSNLTLWKGAETFDATHPIGRYIYYGVREFGMSAILNGLALYGGILPFGGTFLTFSDYARNAIRLAALMKQRVIFVYTHDSIGLGEDGPTHQPVEQLPSLRLIPNLAVWRPCDSVETAVAWQLAIERQGPTCLVLSRQTLPCQTRTTEQCRDMYRGGYVLKDCSGTPNIIFIATGSEVALAMAAALQLTQEGQRVRVISMPSVDQFLTQSVDYQEQVLPSQVTTRIVIEAAASGLWHRFIGKNGAIVGLDHFGFSAPAQDVFQACGFTVEHIVSIAHTLTHHQTTKATF